MANDKEKNALTFCKYYKGGDETMLDGDQAMFWNVEKTWVREVVNASAPLEEILNDYIYAGLAEYKEGDNTPITLKASIFAAVGKYTGGGIADAVARFKTLYEKY